MSTSAMSTSNTKARKFLFVVLILLVFALTPALSRRGEGAEAKAVPQVVERFLVEPLRREGAGLPAEGLFYLSTGLFLQDGEETDGYGYFVVPDDLTPCPSPEAERGGGLTVRAIVVPGRSDEVFIIGNAAWGGIGEVYNTHQINGVPTAVEVLEDRYNAVLEMSLWGAEAGDVVLLEFARYGGAEEDQLNQWAYLVGWMVEVSSCNLTSDDLTPEDLTPGPSPKAERGEEGG